MLLCNKVKSRRWGRTWKQVAAAAALQWMPDKEVGTARTPFGTFPTHRWKNAIKKSGISAGASERRPACLRSRSLCTRFCFHEAARVVAERGVSPPPASGQERVVHGHQTEEQPPGTGAVTCRK